MRQKRVVPQPCGQRLPEGQRLLLERLLGPEAIVELVVVVLAVARARQTEHGQQDLDVVTLGHVEDRLDTLERAVEQAMLDDPVDRALRVADTVTVRGWSR